MKFSQVFVCLTVLFAISFAVPANWKENEDLMASNDNVNEEKRIAVTAWAAQKLARFALGRAVKQVCSMSSLSTQMKGVCNCASLVAGRDEEFKAQKRWFISGDAIEELKSAVKKYCNSWLGYVVKSVCDCITPLI